jgi:hypothetical protein
MLLMWKATEYRIAGDTLTPTGRVEIYQADTKADAVRKCLYTHKVSDGNARVGFTGRTVYTRDLGYAITR